MSGTRRVVAVCAVQALLVAGAVAPQLSARLTGQEYRLAVAPVDPVDPFRGAYVALSYPGLVRDDSVGPPDRPEGTVFVPLVRDGEMWRGTEPVATRPARGPYLRCARDYQLSCGIESFFAPEREARRLERELVDGAVARLRVDGRGNAALLAVEPVGAGR